MENETIRHEHDLALQHAEVLVTQGRSVPDQETAALGDVKVPEGPQAPALVRAFQRLEGLANAVPAPA
jgi:hypothetical protein